MNTEQFKEEYNNIIETLVNIVTEYNKYKYICYPDDINNSIIKFDKENIIILRPFAITEEDEWGDYTAQIKLDKHLIPLYLLNNPCWREDLKKLIDIQKKELKAQRAKETRQAKKLIKENQLKMLSYHEEQFTKIKNELGIT